MPPVIALLTDFGSRDAYAGTMKGTILSACPDAILVDVTHEVQPHDVAAGALIATEAGARVTDRHGRALAFNNPDPRLEGVLAAGPALHAAVRAGMA